MLLLSIQHYIIQSVNLLPVGHSTPSFCALNVSQSDIRSHRECLLGTHTHNILMFVLTAHYIRREFLMKSHHQSALRTACARVSHLMGMHCRTKLLRDTQHSGDTQEPSAPRVCTTNALKCDVTRDAGPGRTMRRSHRSASIRKCIYSIWSMVDV